MQLNYLVSIIIPVYNVEKYIFKCLESISNQSYSNFEVIVIDDGSPDKSGEIADAFSKNDQRFKVFHKRNEGVASARNQGIKLSKGEFIIFVDPDDWISVDHIEYLLKLQCIENSDMCITTKLYTAKGESQSKNIIVKTISPLEASALLLSPSTYVGSCGKLYRKSLLIENNIFQNEKIYSGEGLNFTIKAAQNSNKVTISNKKIYYYRRNVPTSATTKFDLNMIKNNEYSLNVIKNESKFVNEHFIIMWKLFRTHLFISALVFVEANSAKQKYFDDYMYWLKTVKKDRTTLILSKYVPIRSKIRIIFASIFPSFWAILATKKRRRIFNESV